MSTLKLSYVALVARDVASVCRFMTEGLGLTQTDLRVQGIDVPFFGIGNAAIGIFDMANGLTLDEPMYPGVHHLGLATDDPSATASDLGLVVAEQGTGPDKSAFVRIDSAQTCGIRTRLVQPIGLNGRSGRVERIDHLGIASDNIAAVRDMFVGQIGCPLESTETDIELCQVTESFVSDKYGAVYHTRAPEILGGLHGVFINVGDCDLEVMQDYDTDMTPLADLGHADGNTKGDQSAIAKFVAKRGPGLVHVAFVTRDIDGLLASLSHEGWRMIDSTGRPGGRGSRIGFVHPSNFGGGLLMHFVEPRVD